MYELLVLTSLLSFITEGAPLDQGTSQLQVIPVDQGSNFTLPCGGVKNEGVMWVLEDKKDSISHSILPDGSIFFPKINKSDAGIYCCRLESNLSVEERVKIHVRTPPSFPKNVTVTPFTISALVEWESGDNGGYEIRNYQIAYRLQNSTEMDWKTCFPALIAPNLRQYCIYHLQPNSSYYVKIWGNNKLGSGSSTVVETFTKNDPQEIELRKHFIDGVDTFDVRIWIIAVGIVVTTLIVLGVATCCLFYKEYTLNLNVSEREVDGESIELMPNIILNPGYDFSEVIHPDENSNDTNTHRINNNSVIYPSRV